MTYQSRKYQKISMILKGKKMGILILEEQQNLHYEFNCNSTVNDGKLILFLKDGSYVILPDLNGESSKIHLSSIKAAALFENSEVVMKSQLGSFNWPAALKMLKQPQTEKIQPVSTNNPTNDNSPSLTMTLNNSTEHSDCPCQQAEQSVYSYNPFSYYIKNAVWKRIEYPYFANGSHYLVGEIFDHGVLIATALAVPGEYAITPPPWLKGCNCFLNSLQDAQGYWLFAKDCQTGNPVSIQSLAQREALG